MLTPYNLAANIFLVNKEFKKMQLRPYQAKAENDIFAAWQSQKNTLLILPTGAGKTVTFAHVINRSATPTCAIAHRQELVGQISQALARENIRHNIIGPNKVIKQIINRHVRELGRSYYDANSHVAVAGIDTLLRRVNDAALKNWFNRVKLWVVDEAHHVLKSNKWGKGVELFPNAKGLGVTATPTRADGCGLGAENDGVFESMIEGPTMRELINANYLCDYRIFAPPSDLDLHDVKITASGEYSRDGVKKAVRKSKIMGDVVEHYKKIAFGKRGVTFVSDVETAEQTAKLFNENGVPALAVSAETPDHERDSATRKLESGEILQLVNVDLFGEGYDLPAIEVVSMARPTQSLSLYIQQFGRGLRLMNGKTHAVIIDHVGNVHRHGLPDGFRAWTLDRREKRSKNAPSDAIPVATCSQCLSVYERILSSCPFCGHFEEPSARTAPEFVDGDLLELDPATLADMRGEIAKVDQSVENAISSAKYASGGRASIKRVTESHEARQQAQRILRTSIEYWAGIKRAEGLEDSKIYRLFYFKFGVDIMTAQTLKPKEAEKLNLKINFEISKTSINI